MISRRRQRGFIVSFPVSFFGAGAQELTVNGGVNYDLSADTNFTALDSSKPITVTLTGDFYSTNTSTPGFNIGNLSSYTQVDITAQSGCTITGKGGAGGAGVSGNGLNGAVGLECNALNSPSIVSFTNDGTINGGGGGGGGGLRTSNSDSVLSGAKTPTCDALPARLAGGGGGGGGASDNSSQSSGGAGGGSTDGCGSFANGAAGGAGTETGGGGGGARGFTQTRSTNCGTCASRFGTAGGAGGGFGAAGTASSGAPGAAGRGTNGSGAITFTNNGTVNGSIL